MAIRKATKRTTTRKASSEGRTADPIVIYIHGIGEHPPAETLHRQWDLALFGREMGDQSRMCYWADILHGAPGAPSAKSTKGQDKTSAAARDFMARLTARLETGETRARSGPGKKVLPLPGFLRRPITEFFLKMLVKDSAAYFFQPGVRAEVQGRLRRLLPPPGLPSSPAPCTSNPSAWREAGPQPTCCVCRNSVFRRRPGFNLGAL